MLTKSRNYTVDEAEEKCSGKREIRDSIFDELVSSSGCKTVTMFASLGVILDCVDDVNKNVRCVRDGGGGNERNVRSESRLRVEVIIYQNAHQNIRKEKS